MASQYYNQAQTETQASYNARVNALKNQLAQGTQSLDQQKTGINQNYDNQVANQNLSNKLNKNNVSNTMLGRGVSNSSIAVSGLAEQDAKNTRLVGDINRNRTGDLNDIEAQKTLLAQNMNNTLTQLAGDRESEIMTLARQLEDNAWEKNYKNLSLAQQKELEQASLAFQYAQLAQQRDLANQNLAWEREQYVNSQTGESDEISEYDMAGLSALDNIYNNPDLNVKQKEDAFRNFTKLYGGVSQMKTSTGKASELFNNFSSANRQLESGLKLGGLKFKK